jgi:hypothetical protein
MPIVEPTPRFFPDPWSFSIEGLDRMARRLMQYAGLDGLDVSIGTFVEPRPPGQYRDLPKLRSIVATFLGIHEGCCLIGYNEESRSDPEFVAGAMSHEVAHAFRDHSQIPRSSESNEEELLTDLTACYLGFGILATMHSCRWHRLTRKESAGYLPPQALAFLLGLQITVRGFESRESKRLLRHLEPDQRYYVRTAMDTLRERRDEIMDRLGLKPELAKQPPNDLSEILRPLAEYVERPWMVAFPRVEFPDFNARRPVFAVQKSKAERYYALGAFLGLVAGVIVAAVLGQPLAGLAILILAPVFGACYGRFQRYEVCSGRECEALLAPSMTTCPSCLRLIAGRIRHPNDSLEAEDEYYRKTHASD